MKSEGQNSESSRLPMNLKKLPLICNDLCILGSWPVSRSKRNKGLSMNRGWQARRARSDAPHHRGLMATVGDLRIIARS
jgi:hypothetical protein